MKLYGIRNCDTVKKARKWLGDAGIDYEFPDFKKHGNTVSVGFSADEWAERFKH